jgi:hypothetical protein
MIYKERRKEKQHWRKKKTKNKRRERMIETRRKKGTKERQNGCRN